jgi:hypothetical protein
VGASAQRAVRYDSFDSRDATVVDERENGSIGFYYPDTHCVAVVAWPRSQVEDAQLLAERTSTVLRLQFAPGVSRTRYMLDPAANIDAARGATLKEGAAATAKP